jgi:hypothetical protein
MSSTFAKNLKTSLKEAIAHKKGKLDLYSEYIEVPEESAKKQPQKRTIKKKKS